MGTTSATHRFRFRLLGPIVVGALGDGLEDGDADAVDIAVGGPRQRRLLAMLLLGEGRLVPLDRLLEAVWGDEPEPPDSAGKVVLSYVSRLRSVLGDGVVVTGDGGYALLRQADDLDADRFSGLVARQRGAPPATALRTLDDALSLWHGRALGEFADEPWARGAATRLEELRLVALEGRAQARLDLGAHAEAVPELESLVIDHPLRERFRAQLMLALHRSGRQAEAMRCFQEHRAYLADETGLEPSRNLTELERRIAIDDPGLAFVTAGRTRRGYVLSDVIGEGAFATVYRAVQPSVGREVAVKVVRAELADDPTYIRRFETEARLVARLEHPQIVPLYDYWREPGGAYLVFRYLRGGTAADEPGPWPLARVDQVIADVTGALAAAHDAGVVHRDVKPANILFDQSGRAYLADFGIAYTPGSTVDRSNPLRSAGSPLYASPEQVRDGRAAAASDQYALGVVAWELLTGRAPFDGANLTDLLKMKLERPVPRLDDRRPDVPDTVSDVLQRATAVHPGDRYPSVVDFLAAWSEAVARPSRRIVATGETLGPVGPIAGGSSDTLARLRLDTVNPYKGLRAFDEADAGEFFGRVDAIDALADLLDERRTVAVVGPSGSGKSSLVRAGLVPRARAAGAFVAVVVPGSSPVDELADALVQLAIHAPGDLRERLVDETRLPATISELLPDDGSELVVVLDQFEELWTLCEPSVRDRLLAALVAASCQPRSRLRLILTIRADFYDRPLTHPLIGPLVRDATYALTPLDVDSLEQAITAPAARVGVRVEPALVASLLGDVATQPNALPLLQYALTELFDRRDNATMTLATYHHMGGLTGALTNRADAVFDSLDTDGRRAAQRLFLRLVAAGEGTEDTRRRARRSELATVPDSLVEAFGAARLLSFDIDTLDREPTVQVAHEALIRHWPRLRTWLDEDRDGLRVARHLGEATRAWDTRGRDLGDLYRGARLESATDWASTHPDDLNDAEATFLAASTAERDRTVAHEQRQHRRIRRALVAVGAVAIVAVIAGGLALQRQQAARTAQADATAAERAAVTRRLASEAAARAPDDPQLALLLAVEAHRRDPGPVGLGALQRALAGSGNLLGYVNAGRRSAVVRWLDDDRLATAGADGISVDELLTGRNLVRHPDVRVLTTYHPWGDGNRATFPLADLTTNRAAVVEEGGPTTLRLLDLQSGDDVTPPIVHGATVQQVTFSPDGRSLVTIDETGTLRSFDGVTGAARWEVLAHPEQVIGPASEWPDGWVSPWPFDISGLPPNYGRRVFTFAADGSEILSAYGQMRRWDTESGAARPLAMRPYEATTSLGRFGAGITTWRTKPTGEALVAEGLRVYAFSAGGALAASGTPPTIGQWAGMPKISDLAWLAADQALALTTDSRLITLRLPELAVVGEPIDTRLAGPVSMSLSPDGRRVAVASGAGVGVWSLDGARLIARSLPRGAAQLSGLSPDGNELTLVEATHLVFTPEPGRRLDLRHEPATVLPLPGDPRYGYWYLDNSPLLFSMDRTYRPISWDPATGRTVEYEMPYSWSGFAVSLDGEWIAFGTNAVGIQVHVARDGRMVTSLQDLGNNVKSFSFSADRRRLAAAAPDGRAIVWDTATWRPLDLDLGTVESPVTMVRYSPDGRWLVTSDGVGRLSLRNPQTNEVERTLVGGNDGLLKDDLMWFSDDGRYLLSGSGGSGRLWDLELGAQIGDPFPNAPDFKVESTDGLDTLVTAVGEHVLLWDLDMDRWPEIACRAAGRRLTEEEWQQFGPDGPYDPAC